MKTYKGDSKLDFVQKNHIQRNSQNIPISGAKAFLTQYKEASLDQIGEKRETEISTKDFQLLNQMELKLNGKPSRFDGALPPKINFEVHDKKDDDLISNFNNFVATKKQILQSGGRD